MLWGREARPTSPCISVSNAALSAASQHQGCLLPSRLQVGLRPGRPSALLELEQVALKQQRPGGSSGKSSLPVVHNYGHGGAGLTLAWGCAADAVQLVQQALGQR